ncbi:Protein of unknown function [Amycolatopsis tolypomycina]|uniref:DUF3152 domain-containing protein n=1 Tax=Amycolatopsis tolypomycina TaxID=208445 RepID=A0A1H4TA02_9PSEU|nr:Protein of unknown function [Amycolatopsis tolypomycina]
MARVDWLPQPRRRPGQEATRASRIPAPAAPVTTARVAPAHPAMPDAAPPEPRIATEAAAPAAELELRATTETAPPTHPPATEPEPRTPAARQTNAHAPATQPEPHTPSSRQAIAPALSVGPPAPRVPRPPAVAPPLPTLALPAPASRPATTDWWPPAVLVFAVALALALLLTPQAAEPRRVSGVASAQPTVQTTTPTAKPEPAALPDGVPVTETGGGTWHVVPGPPRDLGAGPKILTYTVEVEDGVDLRGFDHDVDAILADPRGWSGVTFRRVDDDPAVRISLTTPGTARRPDLCGFSIPYDSSCRLAREHRIVVNLARWLRGAHSYDGDLVGYRTYAINHEMGHALGFGHVGCPAPGAPAPVMMQQTFGLSNTYLADLNRAEPGAAGKVKPDGAVCRPNPWPR